MRTPHSPVTRTSSRTLMARATCNCMLPPETGRPVLPACTVYLPLEDIRHEYLPDTLWTRAHLARWTGEAGDAVGARDQFAELLPMRERVSGPEHPDTLAVRHDLAYWTGQAKDAEPGVN